MILNFLCIHDCADFIYFKKWSPFSGIIHIKNLFVKNLFVKIYLEKNVYAYEMIGKSISLPYLLNRNIYVV